jgi:hypothetical protein
VVGEAAGVAQIGTHGGDEGEPGLGSLRESFLLSARRAHSFIAPQKVCEGLRPVVNFSWPVFENGTLARLAARNTRCRLLVL